MFSSSVRRALCTASQAPAVSTVATSSPRAALSQALSLRSHQRRLSSSKPSNPADGPKGISKEQSVAPTRSKVLRSTGEGSKASSQKRTSRSSKKQVLPNVPSVPSTHHLSIEDVASSTFFALHRPISVTTHFPKAASDEAFAAIFEGPAKAKPSDVISTLSNSVARLEGASQNMWKDEGSGFRTPHNFSADNLAPFTPPPPPVPMSGEEMLVRQTEAEEHQETQHRTYTTLLTIEESTDANGDVTFTAHSGPFMEEVLAPSANVRDRRRPTMRAISVRRQRKLKMKKHKYKKLMQRTRHERRKLSK